MSGPILIVEDNRDLAEDVCEIFEETGAEVVLAHTARDAEARIAERTFDLAIIDLNLPGGSGIELVPTLKARAPHADVVLVTGDANLGSAIEAVRQGVFAYVQKPFDPTGLLAIAERALAQVALRREREELSRELARSEALYHDVVDGVHALLVGLDQEHRVRMWNRTAEELTGLSADEVLGREATALLLEPEHRAAFEEALGGEHARELTLPLRGQGPVVRWRIAPLTGMSEALVLAIGEDVTDALALEARAAEAEAMAAMGRLTAGLAHEIRNPLNAATLQLEIMARTASRLDEGSAREQLVSRASIVRSELARLTQLLDEFLGLARPQRFALVPVDPARLLAEVAAVQEPLARLAGVALTVEVEPGVPMARGDDAKLKQALVNLLVNALDALSERGHGTVRLVGRAAGDAIELAVEDDGPGLPALASHELFRPFVTTKQRGTGLGLAVVKQILEQHGGSVELSPREGGGTVARLRLKRAEP